MLNTEQFFRDTWIEVNLDHIYENVAMMKKQISDDVKLFAVVKADAYGHGAEQVAKTAVEAGADYLAVAFLDEALSLRHKGITVPILVLGAIGPENAAIAAENNVTVTVFQEAWIQLAVLGLTASSPLKVHIKCDTGMGRIGVRTKQELNYIEKQLRQSDKFDLEGIYTHFATADELDINYYEKQFAKFDSMLNSLEQRPRLVHAANSAASLRFPKAYFNAVRMGISMYGLSPSQEMKELLPYPLKEAMALKTKIVHVKRMEPNESVSYGATYKTSEEEWIATLPVGYADGWIRKLQGQDVLVQEKKAEIVGRICMDQCMIRIPEPYPIGTEVILFGEGIPVDEIAVKLDTINYEVICMLSSRIPRVYLRNGVVAEIMNSLL